MPAEDSPFSGTTRVLNVDVAPQRADDVAGAVRALVGLLADHPSVLPIIDAGIVDGHPFIVTPAVTGESLDAALDAYGPAAIADALPRLQQLADALDFAAAHGLCHGALEPSSIIVSAEDTRVVGLGVAAALRRAGVNCPVNAAYAAPEVLAGGPGSAFADQFALAIIAHEWLCGRRIGVDAAAATVIALPGVDATLMRRAFATATAEDPLKRYSTCTQFVRAVSESARLSGAREHKVLAFEPVLDELPLQDPAASAQIVDFSHADLVRGESADTQSPTHAVSVHSAPLDVSPPIERRGYGAGSLVAALIAGMLLSAVGISMYTRLNTNARSGAGQEFTDEAVETSPSSETAREVTDDAVNPPRDDVEAPRQSVTPSDAALASQADAALLVHSTPAGATVAIDGVVRGTTPVAVRGLELGARRVVVSRQGYRSVERQVLLTTERPSRALEVELSFMPRGVSPTSVSLGTLIIESLPSGASVSLDGRSAGVTPVTLSGISPGTHTVRMERSGYRAVTRTLEVKAGEQARVAARLEGGQDEE